MRALLFLLFAGLCQSQSTQKRESFDKEGCWKVDALYQELLLMRNALQTHTGRQNLEDQVQQLSNESQNLKEQVQQLTNGRQNLEDQVKQLTNESQNLKEQVQQLTNGAYNCDDIHKVNPLAGSGVYSIRLSGEAVQQEVYCDMVTDGGGWLVFQRRQDGSENFYRNWTDYQNGFGSLDGEFWLGNDALASITQFKSYELRVDLEDFQGNKVYAVYSTFYVAKLEDKYRLSLGSYAGNAGDSLSYHNGQQFTTYDQDNDKLPSANCAVSYKGAWWYSSGCGYSNLNGMYLNGENGSPGEGVNWEAFKGFSYSLKFTEMQLRPK